jgi:catechol 2,3-dioxygenase-like lactoylglutathione lyase family enzyme
MKILGLDHVVIRVVDAKKMVDFYTRVVGCTLDKTVEDLGLIHLRAGDSMIDFVTVDGKLGSAGGAAPGVGGRNMDHLCLRVAPFDESAIRARLAAHGVTPSALYDNYGAEGTGPSLYVTDPEGNVIELKGPATKPG